MIVHHPFGLQFRFNDGYGVSIFINRGWREMIQYENDTYKSNSVEVLYFRDVKTTVDEYRVVFDSKNHFKALKPEETIEGEVIYNSIDDLFIGIDAFIKKFNLIRSL